MDGDGVISVKEFVEHLKNAINKRKSLRDLRSSVMSTTSPERYFFFFKFVCNFI